MPVAPSIATNVIPQVRDFGARSAAERESLKRRVDLGIGCGPIPAAHLHKAYEPENSYRIAGGITLLSSCGLAQRVLASSDFDAEPERFEG